MKHLGMKKMIVSSLLFGANIVLGQCVLLQQGQSYTFEFTSLTYQRPAAFGDRGQVIAWFEPGTFGFGASAQLQIFANNLFDRPLTNVVAIDQYPDTVGLPYWWGGGLTNTPAPFFPDFQGVLRVTMLTGQARLGNFEVSQVINGGFYSEVFQVPEPGTFTLFGMALVCLLFFRTC